MRELTKSQVADLREQYPAGSRIRLIQMNDPYHPVPPGTKGTLVAIDDLGTFHVNWDNGRGLGLVPGEDQFEVTPLETLKLYMPLSARIHERSEWGELDDWGTEMDSRDLLPYESQINRAMRDNDLPAEKTRGLMHWYEDKDGVNRKVHSAFFTVENRDGRLWGVAECKVAGTLEAEELETLRDYLAGQASDGWGVPFPVSWTVKMKKKQKETQDILSYHTQAAGCSDKARAKASGGRQPIEECGRTGL